MRRGFMLPATWLMIIAAAAAGLGGGTGEASGTAPADLAAVVSWEQIAEAGEGAGPATPVPSGPAEPKTAKKKPFQSIGPKARAQMERLAKYADRHNNQYKPRGECFAYVWNYIWKSRYGKIDEWGDAADMRSGQARFFAEYMNRGRNAAKWGLRRLPLRNPYEAPRGSVVVVAAGSPGTNDPVAGDIAVAAGNGRFINDGPNMSYGPKARFLSDGGRVLGVYVPAD